MPDGISNPEVCLLSPCRTKSPNMSFSTRITSVLVFLSLAGAGYAQQPASPTPDTSSPAAATSQQQTSSPPTSPQQPASPQPQVSPGPPVAPHQPTAEEVLRQEEKQRALGVVPMFGVTSVHNAPPLSGRQKFRLMTKSVLDPFTFVIVGVQAGISQAENNFPEYGQGAAGYGKRYGAALADSVDSNFFSNFFYPVLFKQDPRYFRLGEGPIKKRIYSALEQEFVARKDSNGKNTFHFSNVLGALTAGGISNAYYPQPDRGFGLTMSRAGIALGYGCLGNTILEFWPDIDQKLFHRKQNQAHPDEPPGTPPK